MTEGITPAADMDTSPSVQPVQLQRPRWTCAPTRLADGTVNLGRVAGEKGVWNVPYITNMAERISGAWGGMPGLAMPLAGLTRALGLERSHLYKKMRALGIRRGESEKP